MLASALCCYHACVQVDGTGKVHTSKKGDPEFAAFNGGLGVFGVITELLIQLTPPTNTQLITVQHKDAQMMADINNLLKVCSEGGNEGGKGMEGWWERREGGRQERTRAD